MNCELIVRRGARRLILIYAGWSTDRRLYSAIDFPSGYDVALVSGYTSLDFDTSLLDNYRSVSVVAWSLGVWAAENSMPADRVAFAVAVNGTPWPCHDGLGIPPAVFNATCEQLDERNLAKFRRRMVADRCAFAELQERLPEGDDIQRLKAELRFIASCSEANGSNDGFPWTRAYIADNDSIFPFEAQKSAWARRNDVESVVLRGRTHYFAFDSLFRALFPEKEIVGKKFHAAIPTYHDEASAQREIAHHLAALIAEARPTPGGRLLEIGPATGFLTHAIAGSLQPSEADFVDLYPLGNFDIATVERYHCADAEEWIFSQLRNWDYIVSASAVQWFADLNSFVKEAASHLNHGGIFAISSFLPGNLPELKSVNPFSLPYISSDRLESILRQYFREVRVSSDKVVLQFATPREALLHLRHTGVGGGISAGSNLRDILQALTPADGSPVTLTYRPVYAIAHN